MPFFKAQSFIEEAIESVFAQTYDRWELLLVDDASTDGSAGIALRYAEGFPERVLYLEHDGCQNRGASASRNLGIQSARGEYIAFLDADDVWLPHKLEQQVAILSLHPEASMVFGLSQHWNSWTGNPEDVYRDYVPELTVRPNTLFRPPTLLTLLHPLAKGTSPCPSDLLARREIVERIGGFEETFTGMYQPYEDQTFLAKVYLRELVFVSGECWDRYRLHPDSCMSIATQAGQHDIVRLYFLNWFEKYLSQEGIRDTVVWEALHDALWPYCHPISQRVVPIFFRLSRHPWSFLSRQKNRILGLAKRGYSGERSSGSFPAYEGYLDGADCERISGWAWDRNQPDLPVRVDIYDGDILLATITADRFRKDLADVGKGDGRHGFCYFVPYWMKDGTPHWIRVNVAGTEFNLAGTPKLIECELQLVADFRKLKAKFQKLNPNGQVHSTNHPLAVLAPYIGALSESFIRRHMEDLLPGGTVVVADTVDGPDAGHWRVDCPVVVLDRIQHGDHIAIVKRFLTEHNVQVLMGEYLNESLPWLELARELGIRFFAHAHGYDVSQMLRDPKCRTEYLKYDQADGIITMSQVSRSRLIDLGLEGAKIHVIPYGVDVPSEPLRRAEHGTVRCLAVGRMVAKKAPILTLDAFRRAAQMCANLVLDYIGGGELLPAARQFIHAFKLENQVTLHGSQPREVVDQLMRDADIFLQHSMTDPETGSEEGLPVAILEAMAHSLPVVSTRHAGIPEAVFDSITGYLVEEGDSVGMAERLCTLAHDPNLRRRLGEAGWLRAKENFSWNKERTELLRILGLSERC